MKVIAFVKTTLFNIENIFINIEKYFKGFCHKKLMVPSYHILGSHP